MTLMRLPQYHIPFSEEIEGVFLSAFLLDCSLFGEYIGILDESYFYVVRHKKIFEAMRKFYEEKNFFDFCLINDYFIKDSFGDDALKNYLFDLSENIFSVGLLSSYFPVLKEKKVLREIIFSAKSIIESCFKDGRQDLTEILDRAEKIFLKIVVSNEKGAYAHLDSCVKNVFQKIVSNSVERVGGVTGVPTGFAVLDSFTSGFQCGDFIVIAARPSMGKTAFALSLARNMAMIDDSVAFVSLEMSSEQLAMRVLAMDAHVQLNSLRSGLINNDDWERLTDSAARISRYPIYIDDESFQGVFDLKSKLRKIFIEKKIKVVIIDYLQLLQSSVRMESRHYEVAEISRDLKGIAKELNIPVIALAQLSRQVESRHDKRPMLSDLRDSGAIEQDADLILFLYRDIVYNRDTLDVDSAEIIIGKHRNGPTGTVHVKYRKEYTLFEDFIP